jgi:hypothetical protein
MDGDVRRPMLRKAKVVDFILKEIIRVEQV